MKDPKDMTEEELEKESERLEDEADWFNERAAEVERRLEPLLDELARRHSTPPGGAK